MQLLEVMIFIERANRHQYRKECNREGKILLNNRIETGVIRIEQASKTGAINRTEEISKTGLVNNRTGELSNRGGQANNRVEACSRAEQFNNRAMLVSRVTV